MHTECTLKWWTCDTGITPRQIIQVKSRPRITSSKKNKKYWKGMGNTIKSHLFVHFLQFSQIPISLQSTCHVHSECNGNVGWNYARDFRVGPLGCTAYATISCMRKLMLSCPGIHSWWGASRTVQEKRWLLFPLVSASSQRLRNRQALLLYLWLLPCNFFQLTAAHSALQDVTGSRVPA